MTKKRKLRGSNEQLNTCLTTILFEIIMSRVSNNRIIQKLMLIIIVYYVNNTFKDGTTTQVKDRDILLKTMAPHTQSSSSQVAVVNLKKRFAILNTKLSDDRNSPNDVAMLTNVMTVYLFQYLPIF